MVESSASLILPRSVDCHACHAVYAANTSLDLGHAIFIN